MKKTIIASILTAFLASNLLTATDYLSLTKKDGTVINLPLEAINNIQFEGLDSIAPTEDISHIFNLLKNYPNPFNPTTTIEFNLNSDTKCDVMIFNIKGEKIRTLFSGNTEKGKKSFLWNGTDQKGVKVASGIYFCKIKAENKTQTKKMLLVK